MIQLRNRNSARRWVISGRGQALAEFALVIPLLVILIFGIIDFGMGLRSYVSLTNATREGARFAAVGNVAGSYPASCDGVTNTTVIGRVCVAIDGLDLSALDDVAVTYPDGQAPGNSVVVSAQYTYTFITPLGDIISFVSGGSFDDSLALNTSTNMRQE